MTYKHKFVNDWAKFFAVDKDGWGYEYVNLPELHERGAGWLTLHSYTGDWKDSLQERDVNSIGTPIDSILPKGVIESYTVNNDGESKTYNLVGDAWVVQKPEDNETMRASSNATSAVYWEVLHGDEWCQCIRLGLDIYEHHAYQLTSGDFKGEFNADPLERNFRPIRTERQRVIEEVHKIVSNDYSLTENINKLYDLGMIRSKGE